MNARHDEATIFAVLGAILDLTCRLGCVSRGTEEGCILVKLCLLGHRIPKSVNPKVNEVNSI